LSRPFGWRRGSTASYGAQGATVVAGYVAVTRRFPPPWSVEETDACIIVHDATSARLAYCNFI
jgi:hypothetical protein